MKEFLKGLLAVEVIYLATSITIITVSAIFKINDLNVILKGVGVMQIVIVIGCFIVAIISPILEWINKL